MFFYFFFFFQAEDGIRDLTVTGVQTCALPIYLCAQQLAESCESIALANLRLRRAVCDAFAYLRRGDGHRTGPADWAGNDSHADRENTIQVFDGGAAVCRDSDRLDLLLRLDDCGISFPRRNLVCIGRHICFERAGVQSPGNASVHVGLEHRCGTWHLLELAARDANAARTQRTFLMMSRRSPNLAGARLFAPGAVRMSGHPNRRRERPG